jgi:23S rRNA pseudouridine2605 synthase
MRKSFFGHRPLRGKPHGGKRGAPDSAGNAGERRKDGRQPESEHLSPSRARYLARVAKSTGRAEGADRQDREARDERGASGRDRFRARSGPAGAWPGRSEQGEKRGPIPEARVRARGGRPGKPRQAQAKAAAVSEPMRIAKAMARAGLCSRREAERWIADGRVSVNGQVLKTPAFEVKPADRVLVDGQPLPVAEPAQLWRYYKPKGLVTTHDDPRGRPTVFDNLPEGLPRVISVGRLDFNTEGLILLTNDGELARHLELPATGWLRRYRVRAKGRVTQADLDALKDGVEIEGVRYGPVEAMLDTVQGANMWLTVGIREGKNREVRKVLSSLGLDVNRLIRISFGPFQLSELKPGEAEIVRRRVLADQLGPELALQFGLVDKPDEKPGKAGGKRRGGPRSDKRGRAREDD